MTDTEIKKLQNIIMTNKVVWYDPYSCIYEEVDKIIPGDKVWDVDLTGPEPCECATLKGTTSYICLDIVELEEFFVLNAIQNDSKET